MSTFSKNIRPYVDVELAEAALAESKGNPRQAFAHLERAHVLGQASTREHVRVHWKMLAWGLRNRHPAEVLGQLLRIAGAALLTAFGFVPAGNTGGANVSPVKPMPIPDDLHKLIEEATSGSRSPS
jgi:hypothetical protein